MAEMRSPTLREGGAIIIAAFFFALFLGGLLGFVVGASVQRDHKTSEAVLKGHARWVSDAQGTPVFEWAPACVKESDRGR